MTGGYSAPATTVSGFLSEKPTLKGASVLPSYALNVKEANFDELFPPYVTDMMRKGLRIFSTKMKCFADGGAVLTAPETRTSSPIRITRNDNGESINCKGLYPCGEGAGYAGGITSAAVDGIKSALQIMKIYSNKA